jgi:hypothetical protein
MINPDYSNKTNSPAPPVRNDAPDAPVHTPPEKETEDLSEIGADRTVSQHIGNIAFGTSSLSALAGKLKPVLRLAGEPRIAQYIPGLNLGVTAIETFNAAERLQKKDHIAAATSAGNAAGCMAGVLEEAAMASVLSSKYGHKGKLLGVGVAFGIVGGGLGMAVGAAEIEKGLNIKAAGGSHRTLTMGILDMTSGLASTTGAILTATGGPGAAIGIPLLVTAGICDVAGVFVDYFGKRSENRKNAPDKA